MKQITDHLLLIRPAHFGFNEETAMDNVFQQLDHGLTPETVSMRALEEFDNFVIELRKHGIHVDVIEDTDKPFKSDAVFPNNWLSLHEDGVIITYPMSSANRRLERREDILTMLEDRYLVDRRYAFEQYEHQDQFLEGTGSMVLDREHKIVYACLSTRTDIRLLDKFCVLRGYRKIVFQAGSGGKPLYHTNVMMALGSTFVIICMDCITDPDEREMLINSFSETEKEVIVISRDQMKEYAGNMLQVKSMNGALYCVMSEQAYLSLNADQIQRLERRNKLIFSPLYTIENFGGGSARCMMVENFLPLK